MLHYNEEGHTLTRLKTVVHNDIHVHFVMPQVTAIP